MTNLIIMCGIPGAGKSTFISNHLASAKVESRDAVRFSLVKEEEEYFSREDEVFRTWTDNIKTDIMAGVPIVVADATHLNANSRRKLINSLRGFLKNVKITALVIDTNAETCLARNENRKGTRGYVPREAIRRMANQFRMPSLADEEFLDEICIFKENTKPRIIERG